MNSFVELKSQGLVYCKPLVQSFAYRIAVDRWCLSGGLALWIALLTVSTQTIRAALANPVEALQYE